MLEQAMQERNEESGYPPVGHPVGHKREEQPGTLNELTELNERNVHIGNNHTSFQTRTERAIVGAPLEVGRAHELLGILAANVGQFAEALQQLHRALAIFEQQDLVTALAQVYSNLGAVHAVKSENTLALTYMQRSLELAERLGNQPNIAIVTGNLGEMATRSGQLRQAEEWFRRSLAMAERINEVDQVSWCNTALAVALQDQGNLAGAAECIRRSLSIARSMKSARNIGAALITLADLRIVQAMLSGKLLGQSKNAENVPQPAALNTQLLLRAQSTVQRALAVEGLETELVIEGRLILANAHFLLGNLERAKQEAIQTLEEAQ